MKQITVFFSGFKMIYKTGPVMDMQHVQGVLCLLQPAKRKWTDGSMDFTNPLLYWTEKSHHESGKPQWNKHLRPLSSETSTLSKLIKNSHYHSLCTSDCWILLLMAISCKNKHKQLLCSPDKRTGERIHNVLCSRHIHLITVWVFFLTLFVRAVS